MGRTINPGIANDNSPLWKLKLGNLSLYCLVLQANPLNLDDLRTIGRTVDVWPKTDIALYLSKAQANDSFVKFVLECQGQKATTWKE